MFPGWGILPALSKRPRALPPHPLPLPHPVSCSFFFLLVYELARVGLGLAASPGGLRGLVALGFWVCRLYDCSLVATKFPPPKHTHVVCCAPRMPPPHPPTSLFGTRLFLLGSLLDPVCGCACWAGPRRVAGFRKGTHSRGQGVTFYEFWHPKFLRADPGLSIEITRRTGAKEDEPAGGYLYVCVLSFLCEYVCISVGWGREVAGLLLSHQG